jgi:hypothetical protein
MGKISSFCLNEQQFAVNLTTKQYCLSRWSRPYGRLYEYFQLFLEVFVVILKNWRGLRADGQTENLVDVIMGTPSNLLRVPSKPRHVLPHKKWHRTTFHKANALLHDYSGQMARGPCMMSQRYACSRFLVSWKWFNQARCTAFRSSAARLDEELICLSHSHDKYTQH